MKRLVFFLAIFSFLFGFSQEHPLSKSDSGIVHHNLEKYDRLIQNSDFRGAASALNQVAFLYWNNNHYKVASEYYERSLELNVRVANENGIAMINNNLGMLYADLGQYDKSLDSFGRTLAARRANNETDGIISALINMSVVLNNLQRYDESIKNLNEALSLAREDYNKEQMRSIYGMLSETYGFKGEVQKSLQNFELYKSFHEDLQKEKVETVKKELAQERTLKQIAELERTEKEIEILRQENEILRQGKLLEEKDAIATGLYDDLSRREIEIELLNKDNALKELEVQDRARQNAELQRVIFAAVLAIALVVAILILIYRNGKRNRKHAAELLAINKTLNEHRIELGKANKTKERIFSIVAHDLRGPLVSLNNLFHIIKEDFHDPELDEEMDTMAAELTNSVGVLDNLLEWSRSEMKGEIPSIEKVELKNKVDEAFRLLNSVAEKKSIKLKSAVEKGSLVNSNGQIVSIVLRNLVQNAIKFTKEGGHVDISFLSNNGHSSILVSDTGIGMSQEKMDKLFQIGNRVRTEGTNKEKGSGLGLVLCNELLHKVDGKIEVESAEGKGTTFKVTF